MKRGRLFSSKSGYRLESEKLTDEERMNQIAQMVNNIELVDTDERKFILNVTKRPGRIATHSWVEDQGKGFIFDLRHDGTKSFWPLEKGDLGAAVEAYRAQEAERIESIIANKGWLERAKDKLDNLIDFN